MKNDRNYNSSRSRNITFSSLDKNDESETTETTDPVYYEAESCYATPVGTGTISDRSRSKSINENENSIYEMSRHSMNQNKMQFTSKAVSEPIDIPKLDSQDSLRLQQQRPRTNCNVDYFMKSKIQTTNGTVSCSFGKSLSENALMLMGMENSNFSPIKMNGQFKMMEDILIQNQQSNIQTNKSVDRDDETSNCDVNDDELLTPINENETIVSGGESYLIENPHRSDLTNDDLEIGVPTITLDEENKENRRQSTHAIKIGSTHILRHESGYHQSNFPDGKYKGKAIHCDGNIFNILYTISSQELPCGRKVFCVWICRDEYSEDDDDEDDGKHPNLTLTFNSIASNIESSVVDDFGQAKRNSMNVIGNVNQSSSRPNSLSLLSQQQYEDEQNSGEYNKYYTSLKQIGKGAFGYVKLSFRHSDNILTVTKFILKDKLPPQFMIETEDKREIPMEVYLLSTLKHPNIVTVLDVFENEKYFQLVMEKHGSGMDLFEFIDRRPLMDEQLGSYIFRQIVNAIDYLHSLHILHRDIKGR